MTAGIRNPFAKPKKKFNASTGNNPLNTEYVDKPKGDIRLDGISYVIVLRNTTIEDIPARLGTLFSTIAEQHRITLEGKYGIAISAEFPTTPEWKGSRTLSPTHVALPTPKGTLFICATVEDEDEAFRRMGKALQQLPVADILKQQNIKLIVRP